MWTVTVPVSSTEVYPQTLVHQFPSREHLVRVADQEAEQIELEGRQPKRRAAFVHLASAGVDDEVADLDAFRRDARRGGSSQDGIHPRDQLAGREGLGQVVVRSELEPGQPVGLLGEGGDHDHRQLRAVADPAAQRQPVGSGQHQVEHDQARRLALEQVACRLAVTRLQCAVPLLLQVADDHVANDGLVVDDENSAHRLIVQRWRGQVLKGCLRTGPGRSRIQSFVMVPRFTQGYGRRESTRRHL